MSSKILFIDDEEDILNTYKSIFCDNTSDEKKRLLDLSENYFGNLMGMKIKEKEDIYSDLSQFQVFTANGGEEGVAIFERELKSDSPIDVVFVDMRMPPGIDGKETIRRIRQLDRKVEFVVVTAYSDSSMSQLIQESGRADKLLFLKKPFDREEVLQFAINLTSKRYSEKIKDEFLSNVTHELRTPLACILGFSELLLDDQEQMDETRESLQIIYESTSLLKNLVDDLLSTLKIERNELTFSKQNINVNNLVSKLYKMGMVFQKQNEYYTSNRFELNLDMHQDIHIFADPKRLTQAILNLITNAFKFTNDGLVEIGAHLIQGDKVEIYVKDTGIGISDENFKNIFNCFYRVEQTHHNIPGLGLGLHISRELVEKQGGEIKVKSKLAKGSKFCIVFPIKD